MYNVQIGSSVKHYDASHCFGRLFTMDNFSEEEKIDLDIKSKISQAFVLAEEKKDQPDHTKLLIP